MTEPLHIPDKNNTDNHELPSDEGRLALDIFDTEDHIFVIAPLAGVETNEIEISVNEDVLTIRGRRDFPKKLPDPETFYAEECFWGPFSRSIVMPNTINPAAIKAKMKQNILIVSIPKIKKASKKISIDSD